MATFTGQKAKMLAGELYMANDPELAADHLRAQALLAKFNATAADAEEEGRLLLKQLLGRIGEGTVLKPTFRCDYGYNIAIGERTLINYDCVLLDCNRIAIGDEVQIAPGVHIYTANHPVEAQVRRSGLEYALPVSIQDGVWLGGRAIVCPGVTIGGQYGGRGRQRSHPGFAVQCSGSRKSLSRHPAAMKQPGAEQSSHCRCLVGRIRRRIQREGTCWCGPTIWQGQPAMRISVSSRATTEADVERSLAAMIRIACEQA